MSGYTIGVNSSNVWNFIIRRRTNDEIHPTTKPPARLRLLLHPRRHPRPRKPLHRIPQSRRTAQIRRPGQLCPENNRSQQKTDFHRKKGDHRTLPRKIRNLPRRMVYGCRKLPGTGSHLKTIRLPVKKQHIRFSCRRQRVLQKKRGLRSEHMTVGRSCSLQGTTGLTRHSALTKKSPDMLGVAAISDGKIIGMAGASADSPLFWQIGINVEKEAECRHIASTLVTILKEEIEKLGKVPYYGTSMSILRHSGQRWMQDFAWHGWSFWRKLKYEISLIKSMILGPELWIKNIRLGETIFFDSR